MEKKHSIPGQQASGLVCTFSSCSNSNPCSIGTCNNGYCCSSGSVPSFTQKHLRTARSLTSRAGSSSKRPAEVHDWPVGPPGYGFPHHLARLDSVLVPAAGDGSRCAGGFNSTLTCTSGGLCPPGLYCDPGLRLCCPLVLPMIDANTASQSVSSWKDELQPPSSPGESPTNAAADSILELRWLRPSRPSTALRIPQSRMKFELFFFTVTQCDDVSAANTCPGGGYPVGQCSSGFCSPGFACVQNLCCPSYSQPRVQVFSCPTGSPAVGGCINGACASGYSCIQNQCCASPVTKNPFVCPNGNQAAGGCVNGQCGAGYTCQNGLCCLGTSGSAVRCLDGSEAVGACIPSCQGGACGSVQISYYCGSGYTCTTGNICCPVTSCPLGGEPIGPPVNGLCPAGYTLQGSLCCSNVATTCPDGSTGTPQVNGLCPAGTVITGTVCCPSTTVLVVSAPPHWANENISFSSKAIDHIQRHWLIWRSENRTKVSMM
ncbi:unnamed protein product [Heligmosomoides polygyrus]|uniref:CC domain-containing protein n=1 Tax=Heligmosomoides polygyrus TaxID=6339 RepID=A0A183GT82_HELPZ|nr:unnamed protein product [Heligmosomoides polygyrus]